MAQEPQPMHSPFPMIFVNRSQPHAYPASMERGLRYSKSPPIAARIVLAITSGPVGHPGSAKSTLTRLATGRNDSCEGVAACPPVSYTHLRAHETRHDLV